MWVGDEECDVDEVVWICELGEEVEVVWDVGSGVFERGEDEDVLFFDKGVVGGDDGVEVDVGDGFGVDLNGFVVVEDDGSLDMGVLVGVFIFGYVYGRFGWVLVVEFELC